MEIYFQMQKLDGLALLFHMSIYLHIHSDEKIPLL